MIAACHSEFNAVIKQGWGFVHFYDNEEESQGSATAIIEAANSLGSTMASVAVMCPDGVGTPLARKFKLSEIPSTFVFSATKVKLYLETHPSIHNLG